MNKDLIKTAQGYDYRGIAITRDKSGFSYGLIYINPSSPFNPISHGRSYPDTLKNTIKSIDKELLNNSIEHFRIKREVK